MDTNRRLNSGLPFMGSNLAAGFGKKVGAEALEFALRTNVAVVISDKRRDSRTQLLGVRVLGCTVCAAVHMFSG